MDYKYENREQKMETEKEPKKSIDFFNEMVNESL